MDADTGAADCFTQGFLKPSSAHIELYGHGPRERETLENATEITCRHRGELTGQLSGLSGNGVYIYTRQNDTICY
jgi:hypothetical protein